MTHKEFISEQTVDPSPFIQFDIWYKEHLSSGIEIPDSVSLGTSTPDGQVSVRTVLMKEYSEKGFVFYTNYRSRKGKQLLTNSNAAMLFYWPEAGRQVRIEGVAEMVSEIESENYFKTRPRESQLSAWASEQSTTIPDRIYLERRYDHYTEKYSDKSVDKPQHWGGFRLSPEWFEFWQNGEFRLHDRITYSRKQKWLETERLAP